MVVTIVRYMEIDNMTRSTSGFGKTLLTASYNIFLSFVLTANYNPHALVLVASERTEVGSTVKTDTHQMKENANKK